MLARDNGNADTKSSLAVDQELMTKLRLAVASHQTLERPKSNAQVLVVMHAIGLLSDVDAFKPTKRTLPLSLVQVS